MHFLGDKSVIVFKVISLTVKEKIGFIISGSLKLESRSFNIFLLFEIDSLFLPVAF
jgi:hypothetical protein